MEEAKAIIIGAGPAGASAAIYLARYCIDVLLIDNQPEVPARTTWVHSLQNYLGHLEHESGPEFLDRIDRHLAQYPSVYRRQETVTSVSQQSDGSFLVQTDQNHDYLTPYLILAVGVNDKMPDKVTNFQDLGHVISHCIACDWYQNKDKKLTVIADTDAGINTALLFDKMHRPPDLVVAPYTKPDYSLGALQQAQDKQITVYQSPIISLEQTDENSLIATLKDGTAFTTEFIFTRLGNERMDYFLDRGGIRPDRDESGYLLVNWETFETSIPNLFAVGPCNAGPDQVSIAVGEGATAAVTLARRILSS